MAKQPVATVSRAEEQKVLSAQAQKFRKNPALGIKLAQQAGILDKQGRLTSRYKRQG